MNIGGYFEGGGFNPLTTSGSVIDQYATPAQAGSQSHSENVKFGMRRRVENGRTLLNHTVLGLQQRSKWCAKIVPEKMAIVRKIFELHFQGNSKIKRYLGRTRGGLRSRDSSPLWGAAFLSQKIFEKNIDTVSEQCYSADPNTASE